MRLKNPDRYMALSMLIAAEKDMTFTLSITPSEEAGATVVRNIYECFRMLGDALLLSKGIIAEDHTTPIRELTRLSISTDRPLTVIDNLRRLRHNINYYGYRPKLPEIEDAISIAQTLFAPMRDEVKRKIK